ncbi:nuclear transport factor 2 family protein [Streptomyces sp. NPDC003023]|uniref:nuclear transport factor 2 family protein n=1 Tax=Streptomyces sp. NPDC003023 TaxID=3364675 RepID=UPI003679E4A7
MTSSSAAVVPQLRLGDLYAQVQQFYAGQVRHLDGMRAQEFAGTFTADGVFDNRPGADPLVGREAIAEAVRTYQRTAHAADPVQRRHWFNMLQVFPQEEGTLRCEYYALVVQTRPGVREPVVGPSCFVTDELVRVDGELRTRLRRVVPDHLV